MAIADAPLKILIRFPERTRYPWLFVVRFIEKNPTSLIRLKTTSKKSENSGMTS
jgi:hypothetical protein